MRVGIDDLRLYPSTLALSLADLCVARDKHPEETIAHLLVKERTVLPPWEDTVTVAVNAAAPLVDDEERDRIELLIVGTETPVDLEKPISSWVHRHLGLSSRCRNFDVQHACYSVTSAVQIALAWLLDRYPGADPERVYVTGSSMGGAGAALMGLLWARHFALAEASLAQTVARNHRPSRVAQLSTLWGSPQDNLRDELGLPVWDRLDLVRALADSPEARDQFIFTRHAKDDPIINFGAAVRPSPLAKEAGLPALERHR